MAIKKSRILIILTVLMLINTNIHSQNKQNIPDSLLNNTIVNVELVKDSCGIGFLVKNELSDTILLRSSFFVDDPAKPSHILIYYCLHDKNSNTINCDYGYATNTSIPPVVLEFFNRRVAIPPKKEIYFPLSIPSYDNSTIFLKVQLVLLQKEKLWYERKTTNSIQI